MVKTLPYKEAVENLKLPELHRNLFSSREWLDVLHKTYGLKMFVKYIERGGQVESYVFYSVVKNFLEWKVCVLSYCDYCDAMVKTKEDWQAIFDSIRVDYPKYRVAVRNLRDPLVHQVPELKVLSNERYHYLDTRDTIEELWRRTHDSFKSAVKQAQKTGIVIKRAGKEDLPKFFKMHLKLRKHKYRLFPQPYRFFDIIWDEYMPNGKGVLLGAYSPDGRMIAGNVYLICGKTMYYKFNTSDIRELKLRPNNLLFWEGIKLAKELNLEGLDLGSSGCHQDGLILFKNHTGAKMQDITHLGYAPPDYKFSQKIILGTFTKFCTLPFMPSPVIRLGSNIIYPYLA